MRRARRVGVEGASGEHGSWDNSLTCAHDFMWARAPSKTETRSAQPRDRRHAGTRLMRRHGVTLDGARRTMVRVVCIVPVVRGSGNNVARVRATTEQTRQHARTMQKLEYMRNRTRSACPRHQAAPASIIDAAPVSCLHHRRGTRELRHMAGSQPCCSPREELFSSPTAATQFVPTGGWRRMLWSTISVTSASRKRCVFIQLCLEIGPAPETDRIASPTGPPFCMPWCTSRAV